jgi:dTDP-4-dehydrorhamnose 3,5-epimerase
LFAGKTFSDSRGSSFEIADFSIWPSQLEPFATVQENLVFSHHAGTARGLHYQRESNAQAKLVTVVHGAAQFFWMSLGARQKARVHSVVLRPGATSLYTPSDAAHGFLSLEPHTAFQLKVDRPVSLVDRGEINLLSKGLSIAFEVPVRRDLLSDRDRQAPQWSEVQI